MDPGYPAARFFLSRAYWLQGSYQEALGEYRHLWKGSPELQVALEDGFAADGPREGMRRVGEVMASWAETGRADPRETAAFFALAGEADAAFSWLERAFEQRIPQLMLLAQEPIWDPIRDDPRFDQLVRRIGIPSEDSP
jgi:class 3 adenylate cyclase